MLLTYLEYRVIESRFHCASRPDRSLRTPVRVETPAGDAIGTVYMEKAQFRAASAWIRRWRRRPAPPSAPSLEPSNARQSTSADGLAPSSTARRRR